MTIALHNGKDTFRTSLAGWENLLEFGQMHGWRPAGTEPPQWNDPHMQAAYAVRNGIYTSVNDADARALAAALEGALSRLPDEESDTPETYPLREVGLRGTRPWASNHLRPNSGQYPYSGIAGTDRTQVVEFIAFACQGRFSILCETSDQRQSAGRAAGV